MKNVLFVVGPTASGKTEYAIRLAESFDGEIVSADSMQVYKYMDIGSAKPSEEQLRKVPHHLIGTIEPTRPFSAAEYQALAQSCIEDILSRNKMPVVCGGTGLYVDALLFDIDFSASPGDRAKREAIFEKVGQGDPGKLHARLKELDPAAAQAIHPNNVKRVLRAIERLEGGQEERLTPFNRRRRQNSVFTPLLIGLERNRRALCERIDRRVDQLMARGLPAEVDHLLAMGLSASDISMKGIGYKELIPFVRGEEPLDKAADAIKLHTRQYAKRQMTWFRRYSEICWFPLENEEVEEETLQRMIGYIRERIVQP